ncbi:MAG: 4-alpha-glucanotransferase [Segetibacter sp.]|nr:4-alpha-glucanotransferase [Segetibacter sp.]
MSANNNTEENKPNKSTAPKKAAEQKTGAPKKAAPKKAAPKKAAEPVATPTVATKQTVAPKKAKAAKVPAAAKASVEAVEPKATPVKKAKASITETKAAPAKQSEAKGSTNNTPGPSKGTKKVTFKLRFHTKYGQALFITGNHEVLGNNDPKKALPLQYINHEFWMAEVNFPNVAASGKINYSYLLQQENGAFAEEDGGEKELDLSGIKQAEITIVDNWNIAGSYQHEEDAADDNETDVKVKEPKTFTHKFLIKGPSIQTGQTVCLLGGTNVLNNWDETKPVLLRAKENHFFEANVDLSQAEFPVLYKYGVYDVNEKTLIQFEAGDDRILLQNESGADKLTILSDGFVRVA